MFHGYVDDGLSGATNNMLLAYMYDAAGQRVCKETGTGISTYYILDPSGRVFATYDGDGECDQVYIYGNDLVADYTLASSHYKYYIKDHLGSTRVTVDNSGNVEEYYDYYPFGMAMRTMQVSNGVRYTFTSKELDKEAGVGWHYFGARYYDAGIGRWLAVDPLAEKYPGLSPYNYCADNLLNYIDPKGEDTYSVNDDGDVEKKQAKWWNPFSWKHKKDRIEVNGEKHNLSITTKAMLDERYAFQQYQKAFADGSIDAISPVGILQDPVFIGLSIGMMAGKGGSGVSNSVPSRLARVVPGEGPYATLGKQGAADVFVTAADDIVGMNASQLSSRLTIPSSNSFSVYKFSSKGVQGIASPINRNYPGFIGGGRTLGGAREFVIPNGPIPANAITKVVR